MISRITQKLQSRQRVLTAAQSLFAERGLAKTRTADIASKAGLSHGGMFVHFKSREDLLAEVVSEIGRTITDRLHALITADADVKKTLRVHLQCLAENERAYSVFLRESSLLPKDTLLSWVGVQSAISVHLSQPINKAIADGRIRDMPMHLIFNTWIGLVHHYLMNRELFAPQGSVLKRHGEEIVNHFLSLIETED